MGHQDKFLVREVVGDDLIDLGAHFLSTKCVVSDAKGDGHYFDGDYADLLVGVGGLDSSVRVQLIEEVCVWVKANADTMYEDNRQFCGRCVRSMPVCCVLSWRAIGSKESLWSEGKEREESGEGCSMEVEASKEKFHVREEIDEANALQKLACRTHSGREDTNPIPNQTPMQHGNLV